MSELIDRIPGQQSAIAKLRGVVNTTMQLKARQRITGRSGQLGYAVDSGEAWDYTGNIPVSSSTYQGAEFQITYTGKGRQKFPITVLSLDVRINGTSVSNRLLLDPDTSLYAYKDGLVDVMAFDFGTPVQSSYRSETQSTWLVSLFFIGTVNGNMTVRIKPRAQSTSDGEFTIVRTS